MTQEDLMMKFTKVLSLILALVMVFAFAACGKTEKDTKDTDTKDSVEDTANNAADTTPDTDASGDDDVLVMATNAYFPPYEYYDGETIVGIDAEIAAAVAAKLGKTLKIEDMAFDSITTAVQQGSVDFGMAGMTITEERLEEVNFSVSYANGVQAIIVTENSPITSVDDLYADGASYKVGVQLGTTGDIYSTDDFGAENVTQYVNGNEAVLALLGGSVDCVIIDNEPAKAYVEANEGLKILETSYADEDYAICVSKENSELLEQINDAIVELIEDGTIDGIIAKYID